MKHQADALPDPRRNGIDTAVGYLADNAYHLALAHGGPSRPA